MAGVGRENRSYIARVCEKYQWWHVQRVDREPVAKTVMTLFGIGGWQPTTTYRLERRRKGPAGGQFTFKPNHSEHEFMIDMRTPCCVFSNGQFVTYVERWA